MGASLQIGAGLATTAAVASLGRPNVGLRPNLLALGAIAVVGCALPIRTAVVASTTNDVDLVQVALLDWITIPFVLAGLVAWWRRPDSRLGPLMIAGGFASGLSALQLTHVDALYTIGAVFDILPAAFFLHVCLAFPDGRLRSRFEQVLVVVAYSAAIGLQLVKMALGAFGPDNLVVLGSWPSAAADVQHVQLLTISAACVAGAFVLVNRRRQAGRLRRHSLALLVDSFAVGLVMIAALFVDGDLAGPWFQQLQRATLIVIGLSPIVFLVGLLDERLGRSAVADLMLELRSDPPPRQVRNALARALRDRAYRAAAAANLADGFAAFGVRAAIVPPWSPTILATSARPNPLPVGLVVTNGSNRFGNRSSGTPGPLSLTQNSSGNDTRDFFPGTDSRTPGRNAVVS